MHTRDLISSFNLLVRARILFRVVFLDEDEDVACVQEGQRWDFMVSVSDTEKPLGLASNWFLRWGEVALEHLPAVTARPWPTWHTTKAQLVDAGAGADSDRSVAARLGMSMTNLARLRSKFKIRGWHGRPSGSFGYAKWDRPGLVERLQTKSGRPRAYHRYSEAELRSLGAGIDTDLTVATRLGVSNQSVICNLRRRHHIGANHSHKWSPKNVAVYWQGVCTKLRPLEGIGMPVEEATTVTGLRIGTINRAIRSMGVKIGRGQGYARRHRQRTPEEDYRVKCVQFRIWVEQKIASGVLGLKLEQVGDSYADFQFTRNARLLPPLELADVLQREEDLKK